MTLADSIADYEHGRISLEELKFWTHHYTGYPSHYKPAASMSVYRTKRKGYGSGVGSQFKAPRRSGGFPFTRPSAARTQPYVRPATVSAIVASAQETKYFDTGFLVSVTSGNGDWTASEVPCANYVNGSGAAAVYTDSCLLPTAIGNAYGQINGNRYKLKKIRVRGVVSPPTNSDQADVTIAVTTRLMLVHDMQPNGSQAQGEDIMQDVGAGETQWSFKRIAASSGRFRILKDEFFTHQVSAVGTDGANTNSVGYESKPFSFQYTPNTPLTVNVQSGNSVPTIAGTITANIFLLLHTSGAPVTIEGSSRAYYCD